MKKFLIATPGRTASTSFFNYIKNSLKTEDANVIAIDRAAYTPEEIEKFNNAKSAVCTIFNPYKFPFFVSDITPEEWSLIVLTRHDFASWLLSMISIHAIGEWHPGKDFVVDSFKTSREDLMGAYWYYKCWKVHVEDVAEQYNFKEVVYIDFNDLIKDWSAVGQQIGNWDWPVDSKLMQLGMTTSWAAVENIAEVLEWLPQDDVSLINDIKNSL